LRRTDGRDAGGEVVQGRSRSRDTVLLDGCVPVVPDRRQRLKDGTDIDDTMTDGTEDGPRESVPEPGALGDHRGMHVRVDVLEVDMREAAGVGPDRPGRVDAGI